MPRGNRMGPTGRGPMTGRGAGYCSGSDRPGFAERFGFGGFFGRGGRGGRRGGGGGMGRFGWPQWAGFRDDAEQTGGQTREELEREADFLSRRLDRIRRAIDAITGREK